MTSASTIQTDERKNKKFSGMKGLAQLRLEGGKDSKTIIKNLKVEPPLLIQKAMYLDPTNPNTAHIYLMSSACGILQGDKLKIDIKATKNSNVHITTQAATKIYKSENQLATQHINILVEKESYLEFLPKQIIPHQSARFYQEVNLRIDNSSALIYSENISCGRIAHGEKFDFNSLIFRTQAYNEKNEILFSDAMNIEPQKRKNVFQNLFGKKNIFSTIYLVSKAIECEKLDYEIYSVIKSSEITGAVSQLPNNSGLLIRMLSDSMDEITKMTSKVVTVIRANESRRINLPT